MFELKKVTSENILSTKKFLILHEKSCVDLVSKILLLEKDFEKNGVVEFSFLFLHNKKIIAVFLLEVDKTFLFCFPDCNRNNLRIFFTLAQNFFKNRSIKIIMGTKVFADVLQKFLEKYFNYNVIKSKEYFLMYNNYKNNLDFKKIKYFFYSDLNFLPCTENDLEKLLPLELAYEKEELEIKNVNTFFSRQYLMKMFDKQKIFKCENNNQIIARVHTNAIGINCKQLGGVYTLPNFRQKGIAKNLLIYSMNFLSKSTKIFVLFVKTKNISALNLYTGLNFKKLNRFKIIHLKNFKE